MLEQKEKKSILTTYPREVFLVLFLILILSIVALYSVLISQSIWNQHRVVVQEVLVPTDNGAADTGKAGDVLEEPVISFSAAGAIPDEDEAALREKVAEPYKLYHQDDADRFLLSLTFEQTDDVGGQYPYSAQAIFSDGVTNGFLVERVSGELQYWVPLCMGPCPFSDAFREAYPNIVSLSQGQ